MTDELKCPCGRGSLYLDTGYDGTGLYCCTHPDCSALLPQEALDGLRRMQEIIDKLPKTADGVPYLPDRNTELWYIAGDNQVYCHVPWSREDIPEMYFTREAAEKARG